MDRSAPEYSQSGLPSPFSSNYGDNHSEGSTADHASAAHYPVKTEVAYPTSATPTSEYGVYPQSARSGTFPEHIRRSYHPASNNSSGGMAQQQNSPSFSPQDGRSHENLAVHSDNGVPIDPSIAAPSPTYPYPPPQASPYAPNPDMTHSYSHPNSGMYAQPRPDWTGYGQHGASPMAAGHPGVYGQSPASAPQQRPNQVSNPLRMHFEKEALAFATPRCCARIRAWVLVPEVIYIYMYIYRLLPYFGSRAPIYLETHKAGLFSSSGAIDRAISRLGRQR